MLRFTINVIATTHEIVIVVVIVIATNSIVIVTSTINIYRIDTSV